MIEEISLRWAEERKRLGYTQADFARQIAISRETMRKWEMGLGTPTSEALGDAFKLGVDVQYVLTGVRIAASDRPIAQAQMSIGSVSGVGNVLGGSNVSVVNTQRHVTRVTAEVNPGESHITDEQAYQLSEMVKEIASLEALLKRTPATHRAIWATLNKHMRVPSYRLIPIEGFDTATKYLRQWIGRLNSMPSAGAKNSASQRRRRISYINISAKESDIEKAALAKYLDKLGEGTLSQLSDASIEKVYRYMAGRRSRH